MKSSLDNLFNKQIQSTFLYNYEYILQSPITDSLTPNLEPASSVPFTLIPDAKHKIQLLGLASNQTLVSLKDDADKKLNCNSESDFIITRSMASSLGIKVGDAIVLKNLINNKILKKQVSGIAESYVGNFAFLNISELNTNLGWPSNSYNIIHCKDSLVKVPGSLFEKRNMREQSASFKEILKPLTIEISAISIIAFLIGLIVIYIISGISIEENTNTITLYKVFGYTAKEINSIVLSSMRWYVIGGFAIGVPLTLFSVHLFIDKAMEKLNILMPTEINYIDIVWAFLILYASFLLTKQINIKKINKMNPAEILKNRIE
jgi:putative ABC transport system permease protein